MKKALLGFMAVVVCVMLVGNVWASDSKLWDGKVQLNQLLCDNAELRPKYDSKWTGNLVWSEFCCYCGAFSYYHLRNVDGSRKCLRCDAEWTPKQGGNYFGNGAIVQSIDEKFEFLSNQIEELKKKLESLK